VNPMVSWIWAGMILMAIGAIALLLPARRTLPPAGAGGVA